MLVRQVRAFAEAFACGDEVAFDIGGIAKPAERADAPFHGICALGRRKRRLVGGLAERQIGRGEGQVAAQEKELRGHPVVAKQLHDRMQRFRLLQSDGHPPQQPVGGCHADHRGRALPIADGRVMRPC